jgi:hypothetical protein
MLNFITIFLALLFTTTSFAKIDKTETLNGVVLKSGKHKAVRSFVGMTEKKLPYPLKLVLKSVTNFTEKCNNNFKSKRKFTPKNLNCRYHNENLVESFIVKDIRKNEDAKKFTEYYLIGRQVYNRGSFGYYELVTIHDGLNDKKQKTSKILLKMLNDKEVSLFTTPKVKKESAFDTSISTYTITELSPNETHLKYEYTAETDHWLLNKEVSVPQVFASISKSINDLVATVENESSRQKRELASQK